MLQKKYLRKIILLGAVALLAVIYLFQVIAGNKSPVKDFTIEKSFDTIVISSADNGVIELKRYGDFWKIGNDDARNDDVKAMAESLKSIRTLGVITRSSGEDASERYGFGEAQKITVTVSDNGREYLSLQIGKDAAGGQQNYVRINGASETYLASGALRSRFSTAAKDLIKEPEPLPSPAPAETNESNVNAL